MRMLHIGILVFYFFAAMVFADYPRNKQNKLNDFANVINQNSNYVIYQTLADLAFYDNIDMYIVTIDDFKTYSTGETTLNEFSKNLYKHWDIAYKPFHTGVLFVVSISDKKVVIHMDDEHSSYYHNEMQEVANNTMLSLSKTEDYTLSILMGADQAIDVVKKSVPFYIYYKWYLLILLAIISSIIISVKSDYNDDSSILFVILCKVGEFNLAVIKFFIPSGKGSRLGGGDYDMDIGGE